MGKYSKLREKILTGSADSNIEFAELCKLLFRLGFEERVRGDHHIFTRNGVTEIINLQPKGKMSKPYQVRQVRGILVKYRLGERNVD
jgi:predicted RNA binding protein YcfA (HicA-like mRNA interferase family)